MKAALILLSVWLLGMTICFGLLIHELVLTKEQAIISQSVSSKAIDKTDKWGREYYHHIRLYHERK